MATLCVVASHSINGVSKLHSEIIKQSVFNDEYMDTPRKFKNVIKRYCIQKMALPVKSGTYKSAQRKNR